MKPSNFMFLVGWILLALSLSCFFLKDTWTVNSIGMYLALSGAVCNGVGLMFYSIGA